MLRVCVLSLLLASLTGVAQAPTSPFPREHDPGRVGTKKQKCQGKCGEAMATCMTPCLEEHPDQATRPESKNRMMACVKACTEDQAPCMRACDSKQKTP